MPTRPIAYARTHPPARPPTHLPSRPPTTDAARARRHRPPSNSSLLVHNLKSPTAFAYAWRHMRGDAVPYDHAECEMQVLGRRAAAGRVPAGAPLPRRGRGGRGGRGKARQGLRRGGGGKGAGLQGRRGKRGGGRGAARQGRGADDGSPPPQLFQEVLAAAQAADQAMLMRQQNAHLQAALRTRGLATHGGKKALAARLIESYRSPQELSTHR